ARPPQGPGHHEPKLKTAPGSQAPGELDAPVPAVYPLPVGVRGRRRVRGQDLSPPLFGVMLSGKTVFLPSPNASLGCEETSCPSFLAAPTSISFAARRANCFARPLTASQLPRPGPVR